MIEIEYETSDDLIDAEEAIIGCIAPSGTPPAALSHHFYAVGRGILEMMGAMSLSGIDSGEVFERLRAAAIEAFELTSTIMRRVTEVHGDSEHFSSEMVRRIAEIEKVIERVRGIPSRDNIMN